MKDLFPGYYRPTEDEFRTLWQDGTFTFDTNILLHVYRFTDETRERLFTILDKLQDRIWVSHQAAHEFQRNRLDVISQQTKLYNDVRKILSELDSAIKKHRIHPYLQEAEAIIRPAVTQLNKGMETIEARHPDLIQEDGYRDRLTELLKARVGQPYAEDKLKSVLQQAKARMEARICPGYMDYNQKKDRPETERYGDALLWFQIMDYAATTKKPIILVTDDKKEDWWLEHKGKTIGPQPSLINEIASKSGVLFYMYTSERFLEEAAKFLSLEPLPSSVREAKSVREELQDYALAVASEEHRRMFKKARAMAEQSSCQSNLKQLGLAAMQYAADHKHYPNAETWCDELAPYFRVPIMESTLLKCPSYHLPFGYAMNKNLSLVDPHSISETWKCVLFYDCDAGEINANGGDDSLPYPARHVEGNNICFTDGHVSIMDAEQEKGIIWRAE